MFHRTISVVASALMMSGAAVALSPAAQAAPETYSGHLQVIVGDEVIGCAGPDDYAYYTGYTTDPSLAYDFTIGEGDRQELVLEEDPMRSFGSIDSYFMNKGVASSYTFLQPLLPNTGQTALWTVDPATKELSATWMWPDSTTEPLHSWSYELDTIRYVGLAVDVAAFSATHSGPRGIAATFRLGSTCSGPVVADEAQAINFTSSVPSSAHPGQTHTVAATGGASGNPVTFSSTTTDHCTIDGTTVTFGKPGTCTIAANQARGTGYSAAPTATQDITVSAIPSAVSLSLDVESISEDQHATATADVSVTAGSLAAAGGAVQFAVDGTDVGSPVDIDADGRATSPELGGAIGTLEVTATYVPADATNYAGSTASATLTVTAKASQEITFTSTAPTDPHPGDTYTVTATGGTSGNPVTFSSATEDECTVQGSTVTFRRAGTCTVVADQAGGSGHHAADPTEQDIRVSGFTTSLDLTFSPANPVFGQRTTATAQLATSGGSLGQAGGVVQFRVDGDVVDHVAYDSLGRASTELDLGVGAHQVEAIWWPESNYVYDSSSDLATLTVAAAATTTKVSVKPKELTATVAPVAPGAGTPTGEVTFFVDGTKVGTAALDSGVAKLSHAVPNDQDRAVSAEYAGSTEFKASSTSTARTNPVITARVSSSVKARNGWYRKPVTISFTCATKGADLVSACPKPVTVGKQGASSVTRTIHTADGGIATATAAVKVDRSKPRVALKGVKAGRSYFDAPRPKCIAKDSISGVAKCKVTSKRRGSKIVVTAKATDVAGNVRTKRVAYRVADFTIRGAKKVGDTYRVKHLETYTLVVRGAKASYVYATPAPGKPNRGSVPFKKAGRNTWALGVTMSMTTSGTRSWNLGYTQGGKLHVVKVKVTG
ncbi:Ig-like domain-containing protein [Aeromicrobium sp.]|uniref:Ig-like domain-containing protein n=1 Tax=Aeromicrobium sp. TaxID=1871063 RepID=UPI0028B2487A|nr:Ig-like domain-containing protein [Aeromicrobium sp.]